MYCAIHILLTENILLRNQSLQPSYLLCLEHLPRTLVAVFEKIIDENSTRILRTLFGTLFRSVLLKYT